MSCIIKYKGKEYSYQEYVKMLYEGKIKAPQFQITTGGRANKPVEESVQKKIDEYIADNSLDENKWALLDEEGKAAQRQGIFDRITEFAKDTDYFKTEKDKKELQDHIQEVLTDKYKNAERLAGRTNTMSGVEGSGKKVESGFSKNLRKNTIDPFLKQWANNNRIFHKRQSNEESVALAMDTIARETEKALADLAKEWGQSRNMSKEEYMKRYEQILNLEAMNGQYGRYDVARERAYDAIAKRVESKDVDLRTAAIEVIAGQFVMDEWKRIAGDLYNAGQIDESREMMDGKVQQLAVALTERGTLGGRIGDSFRAWANIAKGNIKMVVEADMRNLIKSLPKAVQEKISEVEKLKKEFTDKLAKQYHSFTADIQNRDTIIAGMEEAAKELRKQVEKGNIAEVERLKKELAAARKNPPSPTTGKTTAKKKEVDLFKGFLGGEGVQFQKTALDVFFGDEAQKMFTESFRERMKTERAVAIFNDISTQLKPIFSETDFKKVQEKLSEIAIGETEKRITMSEDKAQTMRDMLASRAEEKREPMKIFLDTFQTFADETDSSSASLYDAYMKSVNQTLYEINRESKNRAKDIQVISKALREQGLPPIPVSKAVAAFRSGETDITAKKLQETIGKILQEREKDTEAYVKPFLNDLIELGLDEKSAKKLQDSLDREMKKQAREKLRADKADAAEKERKEKEAKRKAAKADIDKIKSERDIAVTLLKQEAARSTDAEKIKEKMAEVERITKEAQAKIDAINDSINKSYDEKSAIRITRENADKRIASVRKAAADRIAAIQEKIKGNPSITQKANERIAEIEKKRDKDISDIEAKRDKDVADIQAKEKKARETKAEKVLGKDKQSLEDKLLETMSVSKGVQGNTIGATIAAQFNVPNMLSEADIKVMEKLHDRVERAPEGMLKEMAIKDMLDYMTTKMFYGGLVGNRWEKFKGATKRFFTGGGYWAAYYGNMLSGYSTQEANILWSMSQLIVDSFGDILATGFNAIPALLGNEAAQGRVKRAGARLGSMGRGAAHGRMLADAALLFPSTNRHVERFNNFYKQFVGDSAYSSGVYRTLSLVSRVMAAMDTWANAIHYERYVSENMQINGNTRLGTQNLESREIMYNGTRMTIGEALDKEEKFLGEQIDLDTTGLDEMAQKLAKVRSRNKLRQMALRGARAVELYRQNVIEEYGIDATNFADTKTMRNTPTGWLGAVARAYSRTLQPKEDDTMFDTLRKFALRQTVPFLNTPLNVLQIVWDSSPFGAVFQFSGEKNTFSSSPIYDANQKVEKIRNLIANIDNGLQSFPTSNSLLTAKAKYEKQLEVAEKQVVLATEGAYRNLMSASYATLMAVSTIAAVVAKEMGDDEKDKKKMFAALMAVLASFSSPNNPIPNIRVLSGSGKFFDASKGEVAETHPAYQAEFHAFGWSKKFNYKLLPWMLTFTFAGEYMDRRIDEMGKPTADKANGLRAGGEVAGATLAGTILTASGFLGVAGAVEWFTNLSEKPGTSENRAVGLMTNILSSVIPIAPNIVKQVKQTSDGGERYFIEQKVENAPLMFLYKETGFHPSMEKRISLINGKPVSYAIGEMSGGTALFNILVGETNTTYLRENKTVGWLKDHFLLKVFPDKSFEKTTFVTESEGAIKGTEKIYNQYASQMAGAYFEEIQKHINSGKWTWSVAEEARGKGKKQNMTIDQAKKAFKEGKFDTDATRNSKKFTDDKDIEYFLYKKAIEGIIKTESNKARKEMGLALEEELTND